MAAPIHGLRVFCLVFVANSSIDSYLILLFGSAERVTRGVSLYFMANIAGRLIGTQLSGLSYQFGGLPLSLATSGHFGLASWLAARLLRSV